MRQILKTGASHPFGQTGICLTKNLPQKKKRVEEEGEKKKKKKKKKIIVIIMVGNLWRPISLEPKELTKSR